MWRTEIPARYFHFMSGCRGNKSSKANRQYNNYKKQNQAGNPIPA